MLRLSEGHRLYDADPDDVSHDVGADAFIIAFHDPLDAATFAINLQQALLTIPWPSDVLKNKHSQTEARQDGDLLFKGLRVRVAIHTAIPAAIEVSHLCETVATKHV